MSTKEQNVLISVVVATATSAAAWLVLKKKKGESEAMTTRCSKYTCACGKVDADIVIPPANYKYMEIPSMQCLCNDCVGFVDKVLSNNTVLDKSLDFKSPGISNLVLYDSEIDIKSGAEYLKSMKLTKNSPNRRIYSTCCATPMGISIIGSGVNLVYCENIKPLHTDTSGAIENEGEATKTTNIPNLPPMACFHVNGKVKQDDYPEVKLIQGQFAPTEIFYCIQRMALLAFLGKRGPGNGFPTVGGLDIGIGTIDETFNTK